MADTDDRTNAIGNDTNGFVIHFVHVPTRSTCHFKAMMTSWDDTFKQDWNSYETVGRMDPIKTYKRTSRVINFSLEIPSYDVKEAAHNFNEIQTLIQMSYPTFSVSNAFSSSPGASSEANSEASRAVASSRESSILNTQSNSGNRVVSNMVSPPFFRIKFANWLNNPELDPGMSTNDAVESGLYGTIENVKFTPDFTNGFYGPKDLYYPAVSQTNEKTLIPSLLKLDIVFNVLHTNDLGYNADTRAARSPNFPYNANRINNKVSKIKVT
jgi:hypothetical protein